MSSSSAFVVGTFLLLSHINNLERDPTYARNIRTPEDLAGYLGTVENGACFGLLAGDRGVGTFGGSEDHTAILCSQPNRLVQYAYCPVRFQRTIELADDYVFAIASSGVVAEKTGAALEKYNRISVMARTIVSTWQSATGRDEQTLAAILAHLDGDAVKLRDILAAHTDPAIAADLFERQTHFTTEMRLIDAVPESIDASTVTTFGNAAYESHTMAQLHLKNQTPETNRLVEIAKVLGAPAASAFGAGFGGSVWALVDQLQATEFLTNWSDLYLTDFPGPARQSEFFVTRPGNAAITFA
jgi:galactokinase